MIPVPYTEPITHVLIHKTSETHSYDRERILRLWQTLLAEIPKDDNRGYTEGPWMTDEGRIICVFELLDGSQFGDMFFSSHADGDQWSDLEARDANGDSFTGKELDS